MSIDNITFEENDSPAVKATKTLLIYAGSSELKPQLAKLDVEYTKINRGLHTYYVLTSKKFDKLKIKL